MNGRLLQATIPNCGDRPMHRRLGCASALLPSRHSHRDRNRCNPLFLFKVFLGCKWSRQLSRPRANDQARHIGPGRQTSHETSVSGSCWWESSQALFMYCCFRRKGVLAITTKTKGRCARRSTINQFRNPCCCFPRHDEWR